MLVAKEGGTPDQLDTWETTSTLPRDASFEQMDSLGHRAAAWLAQGDLAARRGHIEDAAAVYRRAAEALQDVRF